jgi:hypothetical protein
MDKKNYHPFPKFYRMKTISSTNRFCLLLMGILFLSSSQLFARTPGTSTDSIGSDAPGQLKIITYKDGDINREGEPTRNGRWQIYREGKRQFSFPEEILAVRIKDRNDNRGVETVFTSNIVFTDGKYPGFNGGNYIGNKVFEDIVAGPSNTSGQEQYITKTFHGNFNGEKFTVSWKVTYNTNTPDFLTMSAVVHTTELSPSCEISLGYGFDSYVNGCDFSSAVLLPNMGLNGLFAFNKLNLPSDYIHSARLIGVKNSYGKGSLFGYFPINAHFDKGTASNIANTHCYKVVSQDNNYFNFGPYDICDRIGQFMGSDYNLGVAVAYNITSGKVTTINTGMTFAADLTGELQYSWNSTFEDLNKTIQLAAGGVDTDLYLRYSSNSESISTKLGFQVNLPKHIKQNDVSESLGFTSFSASISADSSSCSVRADIGAYPATGNIKIPVHVDTYGQYIIDANLISNTEKTMPLGVPAILDVTSTVSYQSTVNITISNGKSATYTVKLPDGVLANGDLHVFIKPHNDTNFEPLPPYVTIPDGENSVPFDVKAKDKITEGASITVALENAASNPLVTTDGTQEVTVTATNNLVGKLAYSWDNSWPTPPDSILTLTDGVKEVNLYLGYDNDNSSAITDLKFHLDLPKGITLNGDSKQEHFSSFTASATVGSSSYDVTANINAHTLGTITAPVQVSSYGQFVIEGSSFSNTVQTNPLNNSATLTVSTTVGFTTAEATTAKGRTIALTVKLPDGVVANGNLIVKVDYTGNKDAFVSLPDVVTIPDGENSTTLYLTAVDSAAVGDKLIAKLHNPENKFVTVSSNNEATVTVKNPKYLLPVNRIPAYLK